MKKYSFLFFLFALFTKTYAEDKLVVGNTLVVAGEQAYMVVEMDFQENHDYVSYQFTVQLPDGISLVADASPGQACFVLPDNQPSSVFKITDFPLSNGILKVASNPSTVIGAHNGVLVCIPIEADGGLTTGSVLNGQLDDVVFAHSNSEAEYLDDVPFTITISDRLVLDENAVTAPLSTNNPVNVLVKRTINANEWSTLCLPFDMTESQVKTIFGNDVQLAYFDSYGSEEDGSGVTSITINFEDEDYSDGYVGNFPYIIKTSKDITEFTVDGVTIDPDEENAIAEYTNGKSGNKKVVYGTFFGTYHAKTIVPENCLFLSANKFWYSAGKTKMKAFRGYFDFMDVLSDVESANSRIGLVVQDGETTGISDLKDKVTKNALFFDLTGRQIERPIKGIYLKGGKKVVVK